jgi:hypothetical protein
VSRTLAVIVALPVGGNPGMLSVEAAFESFRRRHELGCEPRYYGLESGPDTPGALQRRSLEAEWEEVLAADAILYWGDFQQARRFYRLDLLRRSAGDRSERADLLERSYRHLLLQGAENEVLEKTILFGGSLLSDDIGDACDPAYRSTALRFFSRAHEIWMRDPVSAAMAAALSSYSRPIRPGVDCALLLEPLRPADGVRRRRRSVCGVSFGRSVRLRRSRRFAEALSDRMKADIRELAWFQSGIPFERKLETLADCDFVVTDIYHLAVNAWREGIPAVCIGAGADRRVGTLTDKKKEILYLGYGARPFYVFAESLRGEDALLAETERVAGLLSRPALSEAIIARMRLQARQVEQDLAGTLKALLKRRRAFGRLAWR